MKRAYVGDEKDENNDGYSLHFEIIILDIFAINHK